MLITRVGKCLNLADVVGEPVEHHHHHQHHQHPCKNLAVVVGEPVEHQVLILRSRARRAAREAPGQLEYGNC